MLLPSKEGMTRNLPSDDIRDGKPKSTVTRKLGSDDSEPSESFEHNLTRNFRVTTSEVPSHSNIMPFNPAQIHSEVAPPPLGGGVRLPSEAGSGVPLLPSALLPSDDLAHACALRDRFIAGMDWLRSNRDNPLFDTGRVRITTIAMDYAHEVEVLAPAFGVDLQATHDDLLGRLERGAESTHPDAGERFAERVAQYEVVHDALNPRVFPMLMERIERACRA